MSAAGATTAVTTATQAKTSSRRRSVNILQLRREVDVQARAGVHGLELLPDGVPAQAARQGFGDVHPERQDRQAHPETDADRVLQRGTVLLLSGCRRTLVGKLREAVEGVAIVEEGGDTEIVGQIADDLHRASDHVLA